jgi:di/tricarboxylate transporter
VSSAVTVLGIALIAAVQAAFVMGGVWFILGRWFVDRDRAIAALAVSLAFWAGLYSQISGEAESFDWRVLAAAASHFGLTLILFRGMLRRTSLSEGKRNG